MKMAKWHDKKTKIKDIFDTIRNFGLVGLVLYLSTMSFLRTNSVGLIGYMHLSIGLILLFLSIYLFYLNISSFNKTVKEEYEAKNIGHLFYITMPMLMFILSVQVYVSTAFDIKVGDDKSLSELSLEDIFKVKKDKVVPDK